MVINNYQTITLIGQTGQSVTAEYRAGKKYVQQRYHEFGNRMHWTTDGDKKEQAIPAQCRNTKPGLAIQIDVNRDY
ncbi:hypothetical protein COOONC_12766 [Cooperia oncophora]